tara:strand:+ start:291 stop:551 length:261 start_codon:yes stop_codon:yes gene_type:complete
MESKIYKKLLQDSCIVILPPGSKLENILEEIIGLDKDTTNKLSSEFNGCVDIDGYLVWETNTSEKRFYVCTEDTMKNLLEAYCRMV